MQAKKAALKRKIVSASETDVSVPSGDIPLCVSLPDCSDDILTGNTIDRHLPESLNFVNKKLLWVLQGVSEEEKRMEVERSNELFQTLISMKHHSRRYLVALHESWFDLSTDDESICVPSEDTASERERKMVNSPMMMLNIVWNTHGFHVIEVCSKGYKFNSDYSVSHIRDPLSQIRPQTELIQIEILLSCRSCATSLLMHRRKFHDG
jgi:hypothetical protein